MRIHGSLLSPIRLGLSIAMLTCVVALSQHACAGNADNGKAAVNAVAKHLTQGGLLVHLGCRDGGLTMQLGKGSRHVIHAMDPNAALIEKAEAAARQLPVAGLVSTEASNLSRLPFVRHLATAVILEDPERLFKESKLSTVELDRILQPLGYLFVLPGASGVDGARRLLAEKKIGVGYEKLDVAGLLCFRRKMPADMDDWPQSGHDSGRTGISKDRAFSPPKSLQWVSGPSNYVPMSRSTAPSYQINHMGINIYFVGMLNKDRHFPKFHPFANSTIVHPRQHDFRSVVNGGKRFLYVLIARNAFSGVKLWRRAHYSRRGTVAAHGGKLYLLNQNHEIEVLDITSGKSLSTLGKVSQETGNFLISGKRLLAKSKNAAKCFDLESGKELWGKSLGGSRETVPLLMDNKRIYLRPSKQLMALDLNTGEEIWKTNDSELKISRYESLSYVKDGMLFLSGRNKKGFVGVIGVSADTGKQLWKYEVPKTVWYKLTPFGFKVAGGLVLVTHYKHTKKISRIVGLDPRTGKVKKHFDVPTTKGICGPSISTEEYAFGDRPINFIDMASGKIHGFTASRPACGSGSMVANGLYYSQPIKCFCVKGSLKRYFLSVSPASPYEERDLKEPRLIKGPGTADAAAQPEPGSAWPTYRYDGGRRAAVDFEIPTKFKPLWKRTLPGLSIPRNNSGDDWMGFSLGLDAVTAPVTDGERVYTAAVHAQKIFALDAETGKTTWTFDVEGRMKVPPTLYKGLCLAGTSKGLVYAISSKTGKLVWRFRAAPSARMFMAYGQLESPWPVVGGVLIHKDMAFVVCGRTTEIDKGLWVYGLDPRTGKTIWEKSVQRQHRTITDLLLGYGDVVSMGGKYMQLNYKTGESAGRIYGVVKGYDRGHIIDRTWHSGYEPMWKQGICFENINGRLLSYNNKKVSVYAAPRVLAQPTRHKIRLFSKTAAKEKNPKPVWESIRPMFTSVDAMVLSPNVLVACERKLFDVLKVKFPDRMLEDEQKLKSEVLLMNAADGNILQTLPLGSPVAADGLAITKKRILVSCMDGTVVCFAGGAAN